MATTRAGVRNRDLLLVGSMPYSSVEEVFRQCSRELGPYLFALPDGEVGDRWDWVNFMPRRVYSVHPDLVEVHRPPAGDFVQAEHRDGRGVESSNEDENARWTFRLKPGVTDLSFETVGYGPIAIESYRIFERLRDQGEIAPDVRFQVTFPGSSSAIDEFFNEPSEWELARKAYEQAVRRDLERILDVVPAEDLAVQLDFAWEVNDLSVGDQQLVDRWPDFTYAEKWARHTASFAELWKGIPDETLLGYHWCYGTWGGWPMTAMDSLGLCVTLSNEAVRQCGRQIDYIHMPVIKHPDEAFFAPLRDLDVGDTRIFLGLIHHTDGLNGFRERTALARRHLDDFGVASVCGYGRMDPAELPTVLAVHRECAEDLEARR